MKNIILLIILLGFFGCSRSDEETLVSIYEPGDMEFGWCEGYKNGKPFVSSGEAKRYTVFTDQYFGIAFDTYTTEGFHREHIAFGAIPFSGGTFPISGRPPKVNDPIIEGMVGGFYSTSEDDGDVLEDVYLVNEDANNEIIISEVDTINNVVKGSFHVEWIIDPSRNKINESNPNNVVFSEMVFEVSFR